LLLLVTVLLLVACSSGKSASPGQTSTSTAPTGVATSSDLGPPAPDVDRIIEHIRHLSVDIGIRLAGSDSAGRAAQYATAQFESWGYEVELQPFTETKPEARLYAQVHIEQPSRNLPSVVFLGSKPGSARATLVDGGTGREQDLSDADRGAIVLIQRKDVTFNDMAARAMARGAAGVIVANNKEGLFRGTIDPAAGLPVVAISQADGDSLRQQLDKGKVDVSIDVPVSIDGTNVIARPTSGTCRTLSGGHYDTVPWAPGAEDNASGASLVLDLARASASAGLSDNCFVLFSGEEEGLLGSAYFVSQLTDAEKSDLLAYFNYDVVAGGTQIEVIGDQDLAERAVALGTRAGDDIALSRLPAGASSDFASFQKAHIPTVMLTVDDLGVLHTDRDTFAFANMHSAPLAPAAKLAFELIQDVLLPGTPQPTP
jgi:aminopeptidase YwaD